MSDPMGLQKGRFTFKPHDPDDKPCPRNKCNAFEVTIDYVASVVVKGGYVEAKATVRAAEGCCMDNDEEEFYFKGAAMGVGVGKIIGSISISPETGERYISPDGGKCVSWSDWEHGFGRITSAGAHVGVGLGWMWVTLPYGDKQFYEGYRGLGIGMTTAVGIWDKERTYGYDTFERPDLTNFSYYGL